MKKPRQSRPDVSIVMPVWNGEPYLKEAIDSVFAQETRAQWELLIVDDGSTDASRAIACKYAREHSSRIRVLQHPGCENRGSSASRNLAVRHANADLIALLDADDVWLPHRLERHVSKLRDTPEAAMIYGQAERWFDFALPYCTPLSQVGRNYAPPLIPEGASPGLLQPPQPLNWFLADESMTPCTCAVLLRIDAVRQVGGFEETFTGLYDDQVFYAKLALNYPVIVDVDVIARYRKHADSCCAKAARSFVNPRDAETSRSVFFDWLENYRAQRLQLVETRRTCHQFR